MMMQFKLRWAVYSNVIVLISYIPTLTVVQQNSMKVAYRCLWPTCGKILTSVVGIKRHVRTLHLG